MWQVFHPPATELVHPNGRWRQPQRSSARYRPWPVRCCSGPVTTLVAPLNDAVDALREHCRDDAVKTILTA
jgi:hypothetical protein